MLSVKTIISRLKKHRPVTVEDVMVQCRLPLELINWGAYRWVYQIIGTGLVIKIPSARYGEIDREAGINHSAIEIKAYRRLLRNKQAAPIWDYLPDIQYHCPLTGLILMEKYRPISGIASFYDWQIEDIEQTLTLLGYTDDTDLGRDKVDNYGMDSKGNLKILDLGCASLYNET